MLTSRCKKCKKKIPYGEKYCEDCAKEIGKKNRDHIKKYKIELEESDKILKTSEWKRTRNLILDRDKMCILCAKRGHITTEKLQVHHIRKRVDAPELAYDPTNLICLCKSCHEEVEEMASEDQKELFKEQLSDIYYEL